MMARWSITTPRRGWSIVTSTPEGATASPSAATDRRSPTPTSRRRSSASSTPSPSSASSKVIASCSSSTTSRRSRRGSSAPCAPVSCRCRSRRCSPPTISPSIVADSGARAVVVSATFADHLAQITAAAPSVEHTVVVGGAGDEFDDRSPADVAATTSDSPAFWLYSSGTTGLPKGVMHRHGSLQATADTYAAGVLRVTEDDRFLSIAKLFFAYGLGNSLTFPFAVGGTAILEPGRPTPAGMVELVTAERPTLFFASPGFVAVAARHRCPGRHVRRRAGDGDRRASPCRPSCSGASASASAIPSSTASARPRRCTSSCPTRSTSSGRAPAGGRSPATRPPCSTTPGAEVTARRHARLPPRPRAVGGDRLLAAARGHRGGVPARTAGCAPATCTPAPTTGRGRSSAATTT